MGCGCSGSVKTAVQNAEANQATGARTPRSDRREVTMASLVWNPPDRPNQPAPTTGQ
jgi:hypothetical protein